MADYIDLDATGADPDDVRAAFNDIVRTLRAAGAAVNAQLLTGGATYTQDDVPEDDPEDDLDEDDPSEQHE